MIIIKSNASFLYNTNDNSKTVFDCLYAYIIDGHAQYEHVSFRTNYLIPYCRRSLSTDPINKIQGYIENTDTFKNLRLRGITSDDLLRWSTSIDIIEQYSIYLSKNNTGFDEFIFNNCSSLWFGSNCQYTFNLSIPIESFGDFVNSSFVARRNYMEKILIHTCYPHLSGCYRGPEPMCLDWREICDGKIDCIGDSFGIDEEYCDELETNECKEDEYRCHNGAQCIPFEFFRDSRLSKDCLDGTDETEDNGVMGTLHFRQPLECIDSMIFACEERTCRQPHLFSCGDGSCTNYYRIFYLADFFPNACPGTGRVAYYRRAMYKSAKQYSNDCYLLLFCKLGFYKILKNDTYNITHCLGANWLSNNCTLEYLSFPREPIFYGYFQPLYSKQLLIKSDNGDGWPSYICTDPRLCLYLPNATRHINDLACRSAPRYEYPNLGLSAYLTEDAKICALTGNINKYESISSLFYCEKSHKYISKHRLIDGIQDCYHDEDESYTHSCSLNDTQRFNCTSETKCLSPLGIGFDYPQCKNGEDGYIESHEIFVYSHLCNHINHDPQLPPENNENDETSCQWWPCHTPYTRCDNVFHCANGIDELNCPNVNCNINEFKCQIINSTNNYYCIPQQYIYEKPVDCINHDFRDNLYRNIFYSNSLTFNTNKEYISWKEKTCLTKNDICGNSSTNDQQLICNIVEKENIRFNYTFSVDLYNNGTLCRIAKNTTDRVRSPYYFSTWNLGYFPPIINQISLSSQQSINIKPQKPLEIHTSIELIEHCNRGIVIFEGKSFEKKCLCPPSYFGERCQWQNQRISLTFQIRPLGSHENKQSIYEIFIYLIDDENGIIHNYEQINYISSLDCNTKYNRYLLYPDRPKIVNHTYSIRIDIYEKSTLINYYGSWNLSIPFPFLPVNRISTQLRIPSEKSQLSINCSIQCGNNGKCYRYINSTKEFCYCDQGYSGRFCNMTYQHSCSSGSTALNTSICLCPLNKFGSKCYLQHKYCQSNKTSCQNNGKCIPYNYHTNYDNFICLCPENFMGSHCEYQSNRININFKNDSIPSLVFAHYIISHDDKRHERILRFKKIPFDQNSIELSYTTPFNLLFIEFEKNYYLTVVREKPIRSENIFTTINQDYKCENISKFLNSTILNYKTLRRLKYYQLPCIQNHKLKCFYDDKYMCVCDNNRYSNCFEFDHVSHDCQGNNYCKNNGSCFQDNLICPSTSGCICKKCYYGSKCELNTIGFSTSLDVIFGYHIKPFISFTKQSTAVKITASITILMLIFSIINGILSILTFKSESLLKVGCGIYLLTNSIVSILTITVFTIKYFQLIIFQMKSITNASFINFSCILTDVLLKILLSFGDWLYAAVAIERTSNAVQGIHFNKSKSIYIAKYVIPIILLLISLSYIHDPISRRLFNDDDEQRTWCILEYSLNLKTYDKFINLFHVLTPFIINILSAICITIQVFRIRVKTKKKSTYKKLLCIQVQQHKHLLISPCILILLSIPRLIISFLSGCMESVGTPWLYLTGYYISFIPPLLIIILFILPSRTYKDEFISIIRKINFISK
ncbi:unnamed protein product [Adineta steineri]|uniref:Uncharacterized protein n=1 Tax=Adineta steineri TaxID=433720 RepID=A0A815STQ5_9BILA|nr:unnamed protein product [Adineta steineri]CAF1643359.1 unnamed protein product [Adineta steineri]